jgi:hypothetical protein
MRIKNATPGLWRRFWFPMLFRDLVVLGGALLTEPASLAAFWHLGRSFRRALQRRRLMLEAKQTSDAELAAWFRFEPTSQPLVQVRVGATYRGRVPAAGHVTVPTIP